MKHKKVQETQRRSVANYLGELVMLLLSLVMLAPFYYLVVNSFKSYRDMIKSPLSLPIPINMANMQKASETMRLGTALRNTLTLTLSTLVIVIIFGSMAAYVVTRRKHVVYRCAFFYLLLGFMIPAQTTLIPLYFVMTSLNLVDSIPGLIVMGAGGSTFAFFLYQGFIRGVPLEIEESAMMDGASVWRTFWQIVFPLLKPITTTLAIIHVMGEWNSFVIPSLFLFSRKNTTLMLEVFTCKGEFTNDWSTMMASMLLVLAPLAIFYIFAQKFIIRGMVEGAVKG